MPEGDTVYLTARRLSAALGGRRLRRGELRHPRWSTHDLAGRTVLEVGSVGKHLLMRLDDGRSLHSHLRMDGSWHLYPPGERWHRAAHHARAVLVTEGPEARTAVGFRLHDLELLPTAEENRLVGHLGPDLLDPGWSDSHRAEGLCRLTAEPATEIGIALLEQRIVAGIGNIYRCETCFLIGAHPRTPVGRLADPGHAIDTARRLLLRNADRPEQSTTGELGPADRHGRQHYVYLRGGRPCRRCGTRVRMDALGDGVYTRSAYYCPACQPLG